MKKIMKKMKKSCRVLRFYGYLLLLLITACESTYISSDTKNTLGFIVYNTGKRVIFMTTTLPEKIPEVTVNNQILTPKWYGYSSSDEVLGWELLVTGGTTIDYTIDYDGIPLSGSFEFPAPITMTCNGVECDIPDIVSTTTIEKTDSYMFSLISSNAYTYEMLCQYTNGERQLTTMDTLSDSTKFTVIPSSDIYTIHIGVSIPSSDILKAERTPDVISSNAFIYNLIIASYSFRIMFSSSLSKEIVSTEEHNDSSLTSNRQNVFDNLVSDNTLNDKTTE